MKKIIYVLLSLVFVLSCTGCSEIEKEHFDKLMYKDKTGVHSINEEVRVTIDPEVLSTAGFEISKNILVLEDDDAALYDEDIDVYAQKFVNDLISEIRVALDENKKFGYSVEVNGTVDFDNMYSDESIVLRFNNISVDCGNVYARDDDVYIDKKLFYTLGALKYISDMELLGRYFDSLDDVFGESEYIHMTHVNTFVNIGNVSSNPIAAIKSTNVFRDKYMELYESAQYTLIGFDSDCVTRIENGTRFELDSDEFPEKATRFAEYVTQYSDSAAVVANDYMKFVLEASISLYSRYDEYAEEFYQEMEEAMNFPEITGEDIISAMDSFKESINSPFYDAVFNVLDVSIVNDITSEGDKENNNFKIEGKYKDKSAFLMNTDVELIKTDDYEFKDMTNVESAEYSELLEFDFLMKVYGYYGIKADYVCPQCGESFAYEDTNYCNVCDMVHDYYEYDENCDKFPGCELAALENSVEA